jgi:hypothetical protein
MVAKWKILEIDAPDGELILRAKYFASVAEKDLIVETEGYWTFQEPKLNIPFIDLTEEIIVAWIQAETMQDGVNNIERRLAEQLEALKKQQLTPLPWAPQVFTPDLKG